jgi:hypothetical protein
VERQKPELRRQNRPREADGKPFFDQVKAGSFGEPKRLAGHACLSIVQRPDRGAGWRRKRAHASGLRKQLPDGKPTELFAQQNCAKSRCFL